MGVTTNTPKTIFVESIPHVHKCNQSCHNNKSNEIQGDQDHFLSKEMLITLSILKLHKNP